MSHALNRAQVTNNIRAPRSHHLKVFGSGLPCQFFLTVAISMGRSCSSGDTCCAPNEIQY